MKDYLNYEGKICVVTGSATGMGRACVDRLVEMGAKVYCLDWIVTDVEGIEKYIPVNVGDKASIDACFAQLPEKIDKFFAFAGVSGERNTSKEVIEINYLGNRYMMDEYLTKRMPKGSAAVIVSSVGGNQWYMKSSMEELRPLIDAETWEEAEKVLDVISEDLPVGQAYTFSKRAITCYGLLFALKMRDSQVRVNVVKPGNCLTGLTREFLDRFLRLNPGKTEHDYHVWCGHPELGGSLPHQQAEAAIYLNSDMASYISGEELRVDYTMSGEANYIDGGGEFWSAQKLVHQYKK
ncbi:MAG: SDR family oxidoreductase [Firmicutes bacterium]|nr:SDR family oxidoreductase [Bacillota bacterium]